MSFPLELPYYKPVTVTLTFQYDNKTIAFHRLSSIYLIMKSQASSGLMKALHLAVGIPCRSINSLANLLLDSN